MGKWRLVIRHGPRVERETFDDLDTALAAMKRQTQLIRQEGPLGELSAIRSYGPDRRVHARFELSPVGLFRRGKTGMDLMGDGTLVPYVGTVRKRRLEVAGRDSPFDAIRAALA